MVELRVLEELALNLVQGVAVYKHGCKKISCRCRRPHARECHAHRGREERAPTPLRACVGRLGAERRVHAGGVVPCGVPRRRVLPHADARMNITAMRSIKEFYAASPTGKGNLFSVALNSPEEGLTTIEGTKIEN